MRCDTCKKRIDCRERDYLINFMGGKISEHFADNCSGYEEDEPITDEIIEMLKNRFGG